MKRKMVAFDLDGTLAVSKSPLSEEAARCLRDLLYTYDVCVISGGGFAQFEKQVIDRLGATTQQLVRLHLMPVSGTKYYRYDEHSLTWVLQYSVDLDVTQRSEIVDVLLAGAELFGLMADPIFGAQIEDRGSQITFSALGQDAPPDVKLAWDCDGAKRELLRAYVSERLPELEVRVGGSTSVDVTAIGMNKAYGMTRLMALAGLEKHEILFFGDKLERGGNDNPVRAFGIDCIAVANPRETIIAVRAIVEVS
jgi:phosphomannomutase